MKELWDSIDSINEVLKEKDLNSRETY